MAPFRRRLTAVCGPMYHANGGRQGDAYHAAITEGAVRGM